jgi:A/G-specific adenine glycosylase
LPDSLDDLLALPGIGPYTARAVLAFAFERDVAVVDTNVGRMLARTAGGRLTPGKAQSAADELLPAGEGWAWNQTMIDLGATHCRPAPRCDGCPAAPWCRWHLAGHPDPDPASGSAHVSSRQAPYEGSDRQARGRVLAALTAGGSVRSAPDDPILAGLAADGLVVVDDLGVRLPD